MILRNATRWFIPLLLVIVNFGIIYCYCEGQSFADQVAHRDQHFQGEYTGVIESESGPKKMGVQVIALGKGEFRAVGYTGGLPGDGWNGKAPEVVTTTADKGRITFEGKYANGTLHLGRMDITNKAGKPIGSIPRVQRSSPTLGAKPPAGGRILFDGKHADAWVRTRDRGDGRMTDDGLLIEGHNSKQRFGDHQLHLEFYLPFEPHNRGQGRANSGCYLQGRYEVQILDSFGLEGLDNECGGIYKTARPNINMCFPPGAWQTYDIQFRAARYNDSGEKIENERATVRHNGVIIHEDLELPQRTAGGPLGEGPEDGFLHLQDHSNPVRFRNIWVVEE